MSTQQIERWHFADHASPVSGSRACRRVLRRLAGLRILDHLERRIGGIRAGSSGFIWQLGPVGVRLLTAGESDDSTRRLRHEPSQRLLNHYLAITETHLRLVEAARHRALDLIQVQLEPASWRSFLGRGGEQRLVRPDLAVVTADGEFEDHWFLEVDLGSEHPPMVVRKTQLYEDLRCNGSIQAKLGLFPRVVWLVPSEQRTELLQQALQRAGLDVDIYRVTPSSQLIAHLTGGAR